MLVHVLMHGHMRLPILAPPARVYHRQIQKLYARCALLPARRHSPLAGSDDLEMWARSVAESVTSAYRDRVLVPLLQLKDELFATFRQRRSIVSVGEYETDKASLERMLRDFEADFGKASTVGPSDHIQGCVACILLVTDWVSCLLKSLCMPCLFAARF